MTEVIEGEVVDVTEAPLHREPIPESRAVVEAQPGQVIVSRADDPEAMVAGATRLANALKSIVDAQCLYAVIQGKKYPAVEAWATIGRLDNVVAREARPPERHDDGSYEAFVDLVRLSDGMVVGSASAICGMGDDRPWNGRPEYARRSMAVTRATSRAFRQQYSWIMALAGYEPTPADEMPRDDGDASQDRSSASARAAGARSDQGGHKVGDEWQDGEPERFTGKVERVPDGLRRTEDGRHVLELAIKVGNSRHTIHAEGNMAAWALSVVRAAGQRVAVDGTRWLRRWDDSKPPMRTIRAATKLMVDVDGTWQMYPAATGDPAPGASSPSSDSTSHSGSSEAAAPGTSDPKAATTTSSGDELGDDPGPGPLSSAGGASGTASDTAPTTPSGSSVPDAATIFDVAQAVGEPGAEVDVTGEVTGSRWAETPGGVRYVAIHILADGHDHQVAIGEGMFHIALLPDGDEIRWKVGDRLRVRGSWNGAGKVIVATWGLRA